MKAKKKVVPHGRTQSAVGGDASPRLPHEHDESSDSAAGPPREVMKQARKDVEAGRVDTTRGAEADAAYRRQKG